MDPVLSPTQNQLLSALDTDVQRYFFPCLELVHLPLGTLLHQPGIPVRHIYFPVDAIVALLGVTPSGESAEISVSGKDGFVGISALLGGGGTPTKAVVVRGGHSYRIQGPEFTAACHRHDALRTLLLCYVQSRIAQATLSAACNRHHSIEQQLCRWLLLVLDREPGNEVAMTQRLIGRILGVRREGVTEAARELHGRGVIEYSRGHIKVLDRRGLEQLSCECYAVVKNETARLLHYRDSQTHVPAAPLRVSGTPDTGQRPRMPVGWLMRAQQGALSNRVRPRPVL